ncbi:MAG TPA: hypothetical protein PK992_09690, partial [Planctomycetaceae bacterium]|nr:hypothetical protein [Planctomycetaceae bacterium]
MLTCSGPLGRITALHYGSKEAVGLCGFQNLAKASVSQWNPRFLTCALHFSQNPYPLETSDETAANS